MPRSSAGPSWLMAKAMALSLFSFSFLSLGEEVKLVFLLAWWHSMWMSFWWLPLIFKNERPLCSWRSSSGTMMELCHVSSYFLVNLACMVLGPYMQHTQAILSMAHEYKHFVLLPHLSKNESTLCCAKLCFIMKAKIKCSSFLELVEEQLQAVVWQPCMPLWQVRFWPSCCLSHLSNTKAKCPSPPCGCFSGMAQ